MRVSGLEETPGPVQGDAIENRTARPLLESFPVRFVLGVVDFLCVCAHDLVC